jgi:uncharacterized repeat protein (TIGR01451 family)
VPAKEFYGIKAPGYIGTGTSQQEFRFNCATYPGGRLSCYWFGTNTGLGYNGGSGNPGDIAAQYGWHVAVVDQAEDGTWGKVVVWNGNAVTSVEKTVSREQAYAGAILEYQIMVKNLTPVAQEFTLSDPIPANTEIVRRINYNPATNAVEWSGVLEPWGFKTFHVYVRIKSGTPGGTALVSTATVKDGAVGGSASATTTVKVLPPYRGHRDDVGVNEMVIRGN